MITTITITGMHCASCKALLEDVIGDVPGVTRCTVDSEKSTGTIEHDDTFTPENLEQAISELGTYTVHIV
jgi:copper chaperone CopZ